MKFHVTHRTEYRYPTPASESYAELRITPRENDAQKVVRRAIDIRPEVEVEQYSDYFGNKVEFFSIPHRHDSLTVSATADIETFPRTLPQSSLDVPVEEARAFYQSRMLSVYDFLEPSKYVPLGRELRPVKQPDFFRPGAPLGECLFALNEWIFTQFRYVPGVTEVSTPIDDIIRNREGVCQDFAHLMIALIRSKGIPARYMSGYIESLDPSRQTDPELIGAAASHAWVEVCLPGETWLGLDPTNNQTAGDRHVEVAVGRDYSDVTPIRGTFKGAQNHKLSVMVSVLRQTPGKTPDQVNTTP